MNPKRLTVICLALLVLLAAAGCGNSKTDAGAAQQKAEQQSQTPEPTVAPTATPAPEPTPFVPDFEPEEPYPIRIAITGSPDKTDYNLGEVFDPAGMTVTATFSDHTQKEIMDFTVETSSPLTLDDEAVAISYGDLFISFPITVSDPDADPATVELFRFEVDGSQLYMVGYLDQHFEMPFGERFVQATGTWSYSNQVLTLHVAEVMMQEDGLPYDIVLEPQSDGSFSFTFESVVGAKLLVCPQSNWSPSLDGKEFA